MLVSCWGRASSDSYVLYRIWILGSCRVRQFDIQRLLAASADAPVGVESAIYEKRIIPVALSCLEVRAYAVTRDAVISGISRRFRKKCGDNGTTREQEREKVPK